MSPRRSGNVSDARCGSHLMLEGSAAAMSVEGRAAENDVLHEIETEKSLAKVELLAYLIMLANNIEAAFAPTGRSATPPSRRLFP